MDHETMPDETVLHLRLGLREAEDQLFAALELLRVAEGWPQAARLWARRHPDQEGEGEAVVLAAGLAWLKAGYRVTNALRAYEDSAKWNQQLLAGKASP